MAQENFNSTENINVPHNISLWFQKDWDGDFIEFGDCVVDGVDLAPEFAEHQSYRNGVRALRKRIMTGRGGGVSVTLFEPNILNLQRALYGGDISKPDPADQPTWYDAAKVQIEDNAAGSEVGIDFTKFEDSAVIAQLDNEGAASDDNEILAIEVYAATDWEEGGVDPINNSLDELTTDGFLTIDTPGSLVAGNWRYVRYAWLATEMARTELFSKTVVEGAAQLQARNTQGGAEQLWHFNSVNVPSNGAIPFPTDAVQSVPLTLSLMEKDGSFGYVYVK